MASTVQVGQGYGPPVPPYDSGVGLPMVGAPPGPPMAGPAAMPEPPPPPPPAPPESQPDITPADRIAVESALSDAANVGAQGAARPSMASEAQQRATNISRILEQQLLQQARPGFGDIISAALQTIQKPGQVDFATALRQAQNQDLTRSYNIANALAGLQRRQQEDIVPITLPTGQTVRVGANAALNYLRENRTRNPEAAQALSLLERASAGFEDRPQALAAMARVMSEVADPADSPATTMAKVMNDPRVRSLQPLQRRRDEEGAAADIGGPSVNEQGDITQHRPFKAARGQSLTADMKQYNAAVASGNKDLADAIYYRTIGRPASALRAEDRRPFENFSNAHTAAVSSLGTIGRIMQIVDSNPAALAQVGAIQNALNSGVQQIVSLLDSISGDTSSTPAQREEADRLRIGLRNPEQYAKVLDDQVKSWLNGKQGSVLRESGIQAAELRSLFVNLAYAMAQANEPGGRFATQDVENAMRQIGATQGDPVALRRILGTTTERIQSRMENLRQVTPFVGQMNERWSPSFPVGQIRQQVTGETPLSRLGVPVGLSAPAANQAPPAAPPTSAAPAAAPPAAGDPLEGRTARDASGNRIIRRNGRWEPIQ